MRKLRPVSWILGVVGVILTVLGPTTAMSAEPKTPADGYDIHIQAPHMMDNGSVGGPFHHY